MSLYRKGQIIEVGYGDWNEVSEEVEDGGSYYLVVDVDVVDEGTIVKIFGKTENILYVQEVNDSQTIEWAKQNQPLSSFMNN